MANNQQSTFDQLRLELAVLCKALNNHEMIWLYTMLTMELLKRDMLPPEYGEILVSCFDQYLTNDLRKN